MYIKESYETNVWIYKETHNGLKMVYRKDRISTDISLMWSYDEIVSTRHLKSYLHKWEVLTEDEYFLEMI